ncbi:dihydrodipicolinate synthase family protein [Bradyrhizobium ivorense]
MTSGRCRRAWRRISAPSPLRRRCRSSCTIFPRAPSRACPTTRWSSAASPQFAGLRDGSGDLARLLRLQPRLPAAFRLLTGDDATSLAWLAAGGHGCVSAMTNVAPDLCVAVYRNLREGRLQPARYLHRRLVPLATLLEREHPAALKFALALLGFIEPATRLPIAPLDAAAKAEVADAMSCLADEYLAAAQ